MPDPFRGTLTPEEVQKAITWLNAHWGPADKCPMHGGQVSWGVEAQLVETVGYGVMAGRGRTTYPMLVVICQTCGFTVFVNAVMAGIVPTA
jgi:hypothetical protein